MALPRLIAIITLVDGYHYHRGAPQKFSCWPSQRSRMAASWRVTGTAWVNPIGPLPEQFTV